MIKELFKRFLGGIRKTKTTSTIVLTKKNEEWEKEFVKYNTFYVSDIKVEILFRETEFNDEQKKEFATFIKDGLNSGAGGEIIVMFSMAFSTYNVGIATKGNPNENSLKLFVGKE